MSKNGFKFYDHLTPHERFKLYVEASGRGDDQEAAYLGYSCPLYSYTGKEVAYVDRVQAGLQIATLARMELASLLAELGMIDDFRVARAYDRLRRAIEAAVKADPKNRPAYIEEVDTFIPDFLEERERNSIEEVLTVWEAFAGFCEEELGIEPEKLLEAYLGPTWPGIER